MTLEYRIGDVRDRLAEIPDGSIDLVVTSPPFLALRSYLPADHPDKHREIGSEPTPADFIDTMLGLTGEFARVLAPHGSICIELGDTFAGSGGAGLDRPQRPDGYGGAGNRKDGPVLMSGRSTGKEGQGWPLAKSLTGIPTLYTWSLAYGRNLLTGNASPAGQWRIRNLIVWARPNPPVGALGDKFRPATSYITVACRGPKRYFDLDAVRHQNDRAHETSNSYRMVSGQPTYVNGGGAQNPAGAPPLDWHADDHPEDGDWLWKLPTQPYKGSHFATFPMALPKRLIEAMCPLKVCTVCGKPSERIVDAIQVPTRPHNANSANRQAKGGLDSETREQRVVVGEAWSDCGHDSWRTGIVLDPFGGSGTTAEAAQAVGRSAILIDLDARNADLAQERVGMFLEVQP